MGPGLRRFWLPLIRLGTFFVAIVLAWNTVLQGFRSAGASSPEDPQNSDDPIPRRMKRLQRRFYRLLERFIDTPASASSIGEEKTGVVTTGAVARRSAVSTARMTLPAEAVLDGFALPDAEAAPFVWRLPPRVQEMPEASFPKPMGLPDWPEYRAQLVTDVYRRCGADPIADVGHVFLQGPVMQFDGVFSFVSGLSRRSALRTWEEEENRSVTRRMLDIQFGARNERIYAVFMRQRMEREQKYLGAFNESRANTVGFQDRTEGADLNELADDQRTVFWDVLRRTSLSQYKMQSEEQIREGAWRFGGWNGVDLVVLPPFMAFYVYFRGFDKKFSLGDTALRLDIEPPV